MLNGGARCLQSRPRDRDSCGSPWSVLKFFPRSRSTNPTLAASPHQPSSREANSRPPGRSGARLRSSRPASGPTIRLETELVPSTRELLAEATDGFLPAEVFDFHAHVIHPRYYAPDQVFPALAGRTVDLAACRAAVGQLLPGRRLTGSLGFPYSRAAMTGQVNRWLWALICSGPPAGDGAGAACPGRSRRRCRARRRMAGQRRLPRIEALFPLCPGRRRHPVRSGGVRSGMDVGPVRPARCRADAPSGQGRMRSPIRPIARRCCGSPPAIPAAGWFWPMSRGPSTGARRAGCPPSATGPTSTSTPRPSPRRRASGSRSTSLGPGTGPLRHRLPGKPSARPLRLRREIPAQWIYSDTMNNLAMTLGRHRVAAAACGRHCERLGLGAKRMSRGYSCGNAPPPCRLAGV